MAASAETVRAAVLLALAAVAHGAGQLGGQPFARRLPTDSKCIGSMASYPLDVSSGATVGNVTLRPPTLASAATLLEFATPAAREEFDARGGVADAACEPLEVINLGQGTTATHGTAMIMGTAAPNFAHWNLRGATKPEVARSHHNRLFLAFLSLRKCAQDAPGRVLGGGALPSPSGHSGPDDHPCLARNVLPKLADAMLAAVGRGCGMTHLHDSPYPLFAASILRALEGSAHVAYMQSLRDPLDWARHRAHDHGTTFLCSPEGAVGARSFFDIAACIAHTGDARTALHSVRWSVERDACDPAYGDARMHDGLAAKFAHHSALVATLAAPRSLRQECAWDNGFEDLEGLVLGGKAISKPFPPRQTFKYGHPKRPQTCAAQSTHRKRREPPA